MSETAIAGGTNSNTGTLAIAYVTDHESEATVRRAFADIDLINPKIVEGDIHSAISAMNIGQSPKLLIVDITAVEDPMALLHKLADACDPGTAVIVFGDRNDVALYRNLRKIGITEYFYKPVAVDLLAQSCNAALHGTTAQASLRTGKLIVFLGVRGGVGTTTLVTSTAWHLSNELQRRVVILDLDLQNGDIALQLDAAPNHALRDALEHPDRVDDLFLDRAAIRINSRLNILASLEPLDNPLLPDEDAVLKLVAKLQWRYRYVIVDVPAVLAVKWPRLLQQPSSVILVSNATLVSARDTGRWREQLAQNLPNRFVLHVMNMAGASHDLPVAEFTRAVGRAPDVIVPFDRDIPVAANSGTPAVNASRVFRSGLAPLFKHLAGEAAAAPRSLLDRLLMR